MRKQKETKTKDPEETPAFEGDLDAGDLDALFKLPAAEFTAARNALAARLKKAGDRDGAERVKALAKPSISAWAVNQLYWKHGEAFKELIAAGERFGAAHTRQLAGKSADLRELLAARREAIEGLARQAAALLSEAGHNPAPDTMRRITTTLEALSTHSSLPDAPPLGRLSDDIDPPGFDSLAAFIPGATIRTPPAPAPAAASSARVKKGVDEKTQAAMAAARAALESAEHALREIRTIAHDAAAALKKATVHANETEKERREAEQRFEAANLAAQQARQRLHGAEAEAERTLNALEEAEREVEKARRELKEQAGLR